MNQTNTIQSPKRHFVPQNLVISTWDDLKPIYTELSDRKISSAKELEKWMLDLSELETVIGENSAWRYIKMTCDTANKSLVESYSYFVSEIQPKIAPFSDAFNKKIVSSPFLKELDQTKYFIYLRGIKKRIELFREENIPLFSELNNEEQKYGAITGAQTIEYNGEVMTLQKASSFMKKTDRALREKIYKLSQARRAQDEEQLNELFSKLIQLRHKIALNAGFSNYRDYKFQELERFDFDVKDCLNFHEAIKTHIVPLNQILEKERKQKLNLDSYRPWDAEVDVDGSDAVKPFTSGDDLIEKTISCFNELDPYFGSCIKTMKEMNRLDLDSRVGKAPGGYNCSLHETGVPFIFMNAVGVQRDLVTMVHEGGHAVHSFLTKDLQPADLRSVPSEVAELASMSMELISMNGWDKFYDNKKDLLKAKKEQLEKVLKSLSWIATIDKFQHWIYENPNHTVAERNNKWLEIQKEFSSGVIDYSGLEANVKRQWQIQLHLFEVPFYYIEYGFAQLGALAVWKNFKENPKKSLEEYKAALSLGYTKTVPEIYKTGGISFDFSSNYIQKLTEFVKAELEAL